jgi:hypothetical protein
MIRRLFPLRWAAITAWTAAAVGWGVALFATAEAGSGVGTVAVSPPTTAADLPPSTSVVVDTVPTSTTLPTLPDTGLVIIRYTPVPAPEAVEIVRTVRVAPPAPVSSSPAAAAPQPAPAPTVTSSGS